MSQQFRTDSQKMLGRLRAVMAQDAAGQARLDQITRLIAEEMRTGVCSSQLCTNREKTVCC